MRLQRIRLQNFRQHVNSTIEFRPGLTGIIGPNGAGKSTILEGIAWAVYGASAARGTNDTIRFSRAAPRARVVVELTFELENHEYRVTRTLNSAELYVDNGVNPIVTGVGAVTAHLQGRLGMTRQEFFNTYFTGQKELQFLAQMGPTDRARFLAQVLGYERLRKAQDLARDRRKEINAQLEGLRAGLPDPEALKAEREAAEQRVKDVRRSLARAEKTREKLEKEVEAATPLWIAASEAREKAQAYTLQIESLTRELHAAQRELDRATEELAKVDVADQQLASIKPHLDELVTVQKDAEKLEELSRVHARRTVLKKNEEGLSAEIKRLTITLDALKQAPVILKQTQDELTELTTALPEAIKLREGLLATWQQEAQDNRTQLRLLSDGVAELEDQIRRLQTGGETGSCPVCKKALGGEYVTVLEHLQEELEDRRRDAKWRERQEKQLAARPADLVEAEKILSQLQTAIERKKEREAKCEQGVKDLWERTEEKQLKEKQLLELKTELAAIPDSYDSEAHTRVRARLAELQEISRQAKVFEHEVAARKDRQVQVENALARFNSLKLQSEDVQRALVELKFDEKSFQEHRERHDKLQRQSQEAFIEEAQAIQVARAADEALQVVQKAQLAYDEKKVMLISLESDVRHFEAMNTALTQLRAELNARVRPELSELASAFLNDITDGRYNALDIDDSYNVIVLEDGEEKPVISGGEEDVANLVLRIAISQMIAERAGQRLSTLFLDEVFGSLDLERRDNVIQLLQKLHDRFEQVVLITHVETVREGLDHVIRLEYDERTGASVVREETSSEAALASML